jgi:hypothetical protein
VLAAVLATHDDRERVEVPAGEADLVLAGLDFIRGDGKGVEVAAVELCVALAGRVLAAHGDGRAPRWS